MSNKTKIIVCSTLAGVVLIGGGLGIGLGVVKPMRDKDKKIAQYEATIKEQDKKLEGYEELQADADAYVNLKVQFEAQKNQLEKLQTSNGTLQAKITENEKTISSNKARITELEEKFVAAQVEANEYKAEVARLQNEVNNLTTENEKLLTQIAEKTNTIERLTTEANNYKTDAENLQNEVNNLTTENNNLKVTLDENKTRLDELTADNEKLNSDLVDITVKLANTTAQLTQANEQVVILGDKAIVLQTALKEYETMLADLNITDKAVVTFYNGENIYNLQVLNKSTFDSSADLDILHKAENNLPAISNHLAKAITFSDLPTDMSYTLKSNVLNKIASNDYFVSSFELIVDGTNKGQSIGNLTDENGDIYCDLYASRVEIKVKLGIAVGDYVQYVNIDMTNVKFNLGRVKYDSNGFTKEQLEEKIKEIFTTEDSLSGMTNGALTVDADAPYVDMLLEEKCVVDMPTIPTKEGYRFVGWSTDGVNVVNNIEKMTFVNNTKFYAVFEEL